MSSSRRGWGGLAGRTVATAALIFGSVIATAPATYAAGESVYMPHGVAWLGDCQDDYPVSITGASPDGWRWTAQVEIRSPDGHFVNGVTVYGEGSDSWTAYLTLCTSGMAGTWRVSATFNISTDGSTSFADSTFEMRRPRTRTVIWANDPTANYGQSIALTARVLIEKPNGYQPCQGCFTAIQQATKSGYVSIAGGATINGNFRKWLKWPLHGTYARYYRARTYTGQEQEGEDYYSSSVSATVRVS